MIKLPNTAFPYDFTIMRGENLPDGSTANNNERFIGTGMSMRDYIAVEALNGMLAHSRNGHGYKPTNPMQHWHKAISNEAYAIADAMMEARNK